MSVGLILEGGGNRGAYTAGVLDVLSKNDVYLPVTYAVSAGACNGMSYLSKQIGRSHRIYTEYAADKRYSSLRLLRKTGSLFGFDFIFGELADSLLPFDYDEFARTTMRMKICATDIEQGRPVFFSNREISRQELRPLIASASLPVVANIVEYNGLKLLDGGVTAPIPVEKAKSDGIRSYIAVLTREKDYVKKPKPDFPLFYLRRRYKEYPRLIEAMVRRAGVYNAERAQCYRDQQEGRAIVIQPSRPINIKRQCKDSAVLEEIYQLGVQDATERLVEINRFLAMKQER